ncbi:heme peroxidase, partial [Parasponia andersonii]
KGLFTLNIYDVNASTNSTVEFYTDKLQSFLYEFGKAMIKMGNFSPLTGSTGEIRLNCRRKN